MQHPRRFRTRLILSLGCNLLIAVFTGVAWAMMAARWTDSGLLSAEGLDSLKYFTVLSNLLSGLAALLTAVWQARWLATGREPPRWLRRLKLAAVVSVALTFLVVMGFLGWLFGWGGMFLGANLYFHLLLPLFSLAAYALVEPWPGLTSREAWWGTVPLLLYGAVYGGNIVVNGVGEWPHPNDFYGFATWGLPAGFAILALLALITWSVGRMLYFLHRTMDRRWAD